MNRLNSMQLLSMKTHSSLPARPPGPKHRPACCLRMAKPALAHVPIRRNRLIDKNMRQIKSLSMNLSQKWVPLLRVMLWIMLQESVWKITSTVGIEFNSLGS